MCECPVKLVKLFFSCEFSLSFSAISGPTTRGFAIKPFLKLSFPVTDPSLLPTVVVVVEGAGFGSISCHRAVKTEQNFIGPGA